MEFPTFRLTMGNSFADLRDCSSRIIAFLQDRRVDPRAVYRIDLVLEELIGNTLTYGYRDSHPHTIQVAVTIEPAAILLCIEDDADAFDPINAGPGTDVPADADGGRGLLLVHALILGGSYRRAETGNHLEVRVARDA